MTVQVVLRCMIPAIDRLIYLSETLRKTDVSTETGDLLKMLYVLKTQIKKEIAKYE